MDMFIIHIGVKTNNMKLPSFIKKENTALELRCHSGCIIPNMSTSYIIMGKRMCGACYSNFLLKTNGGFKINYFND